MLVKHWSWVNLRDWLVRFAILAGAILSGHLSRSDDFIYFHNGVDYWGEASLRVRAAVSSDKGKEARGPNDSQSENGSHPFAWRKYLDPKNEEFFKEGSYTPPAPFMEIVRNPSDSNLRMWFEYIARKNELSARLQSRMQVYLAKNQASLPADERERVESRVKALPTAAIDSMRFRFRLYFDSHCPHCRRMLGTMAELQGRGYFVEARQVDRDPGALTGLPIPVEQASKGEIDRKGIRSVPVLLVGDLLKKVVYRINGYQSMSQVLSALPKDRGG